MNFLMLFFFAQTSMAAYIPIKEKTPSEFHHVIETLQTTNLYSAHKEEINSLIPQIDRALSSLANDDINTIIKSEIFKTLLTSPLSSKRSLLSLSHKTTDDLYRLSQKIDSPFLSWFALSIHTDLKSLVLSPLFPHFKKKIKSGQGKWNSQMAIMKKKFSLLLPWHDFLTTTPKEQLIEKMYPLLLKCLRQIHFKSIRYASLVPLHSPSQDELQYFKEKLSDKKNNPLDSLLNPIIENNKKIDLPEPVDDWIPKKDDYTKKLPSPTNDWLPEPVDDWKL